MQAASARTELLARRAGDWDVTITLRRTPDAAPIQAAAVATRTMVGNYLQETMRPVPGSDTRDFRRIAYVHFSPVEGRWQYVSLDTRFPVGIMPAMSFDAGTATNITFVFEPLAFVGFGEDVQGRMVRSNLVLTFDRDDHDVAEQHWVQADGTGRPWLAVRYEFTKKR